MFLGFILATTSIQTNQKASTTVAVLVPLALLGVPILDTLLAISRRAMRGRPLFRADRDHIHHRLLAIGLSHRQAVLVLYGVCLLFGATALILTVANGLLTTLTLAAVAVVSFVFLRRLGYMRFESGAVLSDQRRRSRDLRMLIRPFTDRLRHSMAPSEIWGVVRDMAEAIGACGVALHLGDSEHDGGIAGDTLSANVLTFSANLASSAVLAGPPHPPTPQDVASIGGEPLFRARFGLIGLRHDEGHLEFRWSDGRRELDRDTEICVELFCDHVAATYERTGGRSPKESARGAKVRS
jgi:UDP-GlcNAc:undecaprenyl-phosphate GlcNAc-1-phosphate transferase